MLRNLILTAVLASTALLSGAETASAGTFAMSAVFRNFCCTDWTGRTDVPPKPSPGGGAPLLKGGFIREPATVARTVVQNTAGAFPFQLTLPANRIATTTMAVGLPHPNPLFDRLTLAFDGHNEQGVFAANGGPGSFTFCPESVGPAVGACAAPLSATGGPSNLPYHGRIQVTAGANKFGGAMRMLGAGTGGVIRARNAAGAAATKFTNIFFNLPFSVIGGGNIANPIAVGAITGMQTFFNTVGRLPAAQIGLPLVTPGRATGHMWTTGMVTASITAMNVPPFQAVTLTGMDSRIAAAGPNIGNGNVTLVSGNLYQNLGTGVPQVRGNRISMNLPEPAAAMGVGAGALILVLAGAARKRR